MSDVEMNELLWEQCVVAPRPELDVNAVKKRFWRLMENEVADVFRQASSQLFRQESATVKLQKLQAALRGALLAGGVRPDIAARWELYNSNLFPAHWSMDAPPPIEESPVSITLNCAPPPEESQACVCPEDGSPASMPPTWTPDYVTAILDALTAEGLWPSGVVPLVVEYRCVCPALLAYSETLDSMEGAKAKAPPFAFADGCGLGCGGTNCRRRAVGTDEADDDGRTRHGFLCGSYPESATTPSQRERQLRWFGLRSSLVRVPAHHRGGALTL